MNLRKIIVREGEGLSELSARLGVPACAVLRANRVFSGAWLCPGSEINAPDADFCLRDGGICPARAVNCAANAARPGVIVEPGRESPARIAARLGITERLVYLASGGNPSGRAAILLHPPTGRFVIYTVQIGDTLSGICRAHGADEGDVRRENCLWGPAIPGMRIVIVYGPGV